jgi:DNA polymerase-1
MHTTFNIHGTGTGRLSSVDENMQNVPKKIGDHNIKKSFIPTNPDTQVIMNADAKAAEVRVYAAYSQDKNLIKALNDGMDPHSFFSSRILNPKTVVESIPRSERRTALSLIGIDDEHAWNYEDFQNRGVFSGTSENPGSEPKYGQQLEKLRSNIKRVVFGVLYGAAPKKVSSIVGIAEEQGAAIIAQLFKMFPTLEKYIDNTKEKVRRLGCVETFFGRRRRFQLNGMTFGMRNKAERQAVNMLVQSTSSDIIMRVLVDIDRVIEADFGGRLLITVHDSVVAEIPKEYISQMPDFIHEYGVKRVRENYRWMPVPFLWDVEVGPSYGELSSVDAYLAGHQHVDQISRDDYLDHEIKSDFERLAR